MRQNIRFFDWRSPQGFSCRVCGCASVARSTEERQGAGAQGNLGHKDRQGDKGASAWRCERAWDVGQKWQQKWQQGCSGGGLTSKGVGGGHRPTSFQAFVSAEVTMAQSQNPLFAICSVMQISRERSAKDPRRARWRTPKASLTGIFHCGIPIYGLLPLCITGNTVTHTKARPWNTFRSSLRGMGAAVRLQEVSKRRARLCAGTGSHAVEPRQPKPANGASWIFHSFLPFPFPPLDPGKGQRFRFSPTGGLGYGFRVGTDQRAEC